MSKQSIPDLPVGEKSGTGDSPPVNFKIDGTVVTLTVDQVHEAEALGQLAPVQRGVRARQSVAVEVARVAFSCADRLPPLSRITELRVQVSRWDEAVR